ncbi:MAG: hypothetical protein RR410_08510 [Alistipes sp.]
MKIRIFTHPIALLLFGASLLTSGCIKEIESPTISDQQTVSLQIKVASTLATPPAAPRGTTGVATRAQEDEISRVRMILFSCDASGVVKELIANRLNTGTATFTQRVSVGYVRIILIANELDSWNLQTVTSPAQLNALQFANELAATRTPPFSMYSDSVVAVSDTSYNFTIQLMRTVAKVTLDLRCGYAALPEKISLQSVTLRSLPKISYLVAQPYNGASGFFASTAVALDLNSGNIIYTQDSLKTKAGGLSFYIPEHQVVSTINYTYLDILAVHTDDPTRTFSYRIPIGDGAGKLYATPPTALVNLTAQELSVNRNRHYRISANIKGTDMLDLATKITVGDWTVDNSTNGYLVPAYMNCSVIAATINTLKSVRIYFWTNMSTAYIATKIYVHRAGGVVQATTEGLYVGLISGAGVNSGPNFNFNPTTGLGYVDFQIKSSHTPPLQRNDVLFTTLYAGSTFRYLQLTYIP